MKVARPPSSLRWWGLQRGGARTSARCSRDSRIGHRLPTTYTRFAHLENLRDVPLLDIFVYAILDSHVRAPLAATGTGDAFLGTAPQTEIRSGS